MCFLYIHRERYIHIDIREHDIIQVYYDIAKYLIMKGLNVHYYFENKANLHYENEVEVHMRSKSYKQNYHGIANRPIQIMCLICLIGISDGLRPVYLSCSYTKPVVNVSPWLSSQK